eukprot:s2922_g4.t1
MSCSCDGLWQEEFLADDHVTFVECENGLQSIDNLLTRVRMVHAPRHHHVDRMMNRHDNRMMMNFLTTGWNDFGGLFPDFPMEESTPGSYVRDEPFLEFPEEWAEDVKEEEGEVKDVKEEEGDEEMNQDEDRMGSAEHADDTEAKELKG